MKKIILSILVLYIFATISFAQQFDNSPSIRWQKSYWPESHTCYNDNPQNYLYAKNTDEDWFYKSCLSYNGNQFDGFVCAGYTSTKKIKDEGTCYQSNVYVGWRAKVAKVDPNGKEIWYKDFGDIFSELYSIIQGSDGYYYAIGRSHDFGNSIIYNPGSLQQHLSGTFSKDNPRNSMRHLYIIKLDLNGNLIWQYTYGPYDNTNYPPLTRAMGFDIVESKPGQFIAVGFSQEFDGVNVDPNNGTSAGVEHPFIVEIDKNGAIIWKKHYLDIIGRAFSIDKREYVQSGIIKREYVVAGDKHHIVNNKPETKDGLVFKLDETTNPIPQNLTIIPSDNKKGSHGYDVLFRPDGRIILPLVFNCDGIAEGGEATGRILNFTNNLSTFSEVSIGTIKANDLKIGVNNTSDGGYILTTTKQPLPPIPGRDNFWDTDAYVAKFNSSNLLEWEKIIANDIKLDLGDEDVEKEECVYNVLEHPWGGFLITGNISHNIDDDYLILVNDDCSIKSQFNFDKGINITNNTIWNSNKTIMGNVVVKSGATLIITGSNTVIQFADTKLTGVDTKIIVEPGAKLNILEGAKLTALLTCPGSMWDGIVVLGKSNASQNILNQGVLFMRGGSTIEYARAAVFTGEKASEEYSYSKKTGGIIDVENVTFKDNFQSIVINSYSFGKPTTYVSNISNCMFQNTGVMRDRDYIDISDRAMGIKDYISVSSINKINIVGNTFIGNLDLPIDLRGIAINSFNSHLFVKQNTFTSLSYGVYQSAILSTQGISTIANNQFVNVRKGIMALTAAFQNISSNYFSIPGDVFNFSTPIIPTFKNASWGIKLENSHSFNVNQNIYQAYEEQNINSAWGTIVSNSSNFACIIEKDIYQNIAYGTQTEEYNPKLSIKCNNYSNHFNAWSINPQSSYGVIKDQGEGANTDQKQAGDIFDNICTNSNQEINSTVSFKYYAAKDALVKCASTNVNVKNSSNTNIVTCGEQLFKCDGGIAECATSWEKEIRDEQDLNKKQLMLNEYVHQLIENEREALAIAYLENSANTVVEYNSLQRILISTYYSKKEFEQARRKLILYPIIDNNDEDFSRLMNVLLYADSLSTDIFYFTQDEIAELENIALGNNQTAYLSKSILRNVKGLNIDDTPEYWDIIEEGKSIVANEYADLNAKENATKSKSNNNLVRLYPNPANDFINIESPSAYIEVFDILGKRIDSYSKENDLLQINIHSFENGMYVLRFKFLNNETKSLKLIINK